MNVLKDNCSLCCKNDLLQKNIFGPQAIRNTFFIVNKEQFDAASATNAQFCTICTHKLHLSILLKKQYDEMCNRNNNFAPTKCYFCEDKAAHLVSLNDNPNNTHEKLNIFLSSVIIQHEYKNLSSCIRCLYNLDVWSEIRNNLYKSMNIPVTSVRNEDATNNNVSSPRSAFSSTKSSKSRKRTLRNTIPVRTQKSDCQSNLYTIPLQAQTFYWQNYLQEKLKNFKTVDKLMEEGHYNLHSTIIENAEDKLFNALPFVEICMSSQINKEKILENKEDVLPTIVLSDSDNDTNYEDINGRTPRTKLNMSLKKTNITEKSTERKRTRKIGPRSKQNRFRIKFPMKKSIKVIPISDNDDYPEETVSSDPSSIENESNKLICKTCDKSFTSKCEYLMHDLKHTQIENLIVKVRRDSLCAKLNESGKAQDQSLPPADVKKLLSKWLGNEAAKEYTDTEENNENKKLEENEKSKETEGIESVEESPKVKKIQAEEMLAENEVEADKDMGVDIIESSDTEKTKDDGTDRGTDSDEIELLNEKNKSNDERQRSKKNNFSVKKRTDKNSKRENEEKDAESDNNMESHIIESSDTEMINEEESEHKNEPSNRDLIKKKKKSNDDTQRSKKNKISDKERTDESSKKENEEREVQTDNNDNANLKNGDHTRGHAEACTTSADESQSGNDKTTNESPSKETNNETIQNASSKTVSKSIDFDDDSSNSLGSPSAQAISCADLLNILETNIDSEVLETSTTAMENDKVTKSPAEKILKRKRESLETDSTPKKKKVRFSDKKEVFTPDKSGVVIETVIENDVFLRDDVDEEEEENAIHAEEEKDGDHEEEETEEHRETEELEKEAEEEEKEAEEVEKEAEEEENEAEQEEKEAEEEAKEAEDEAKEAEDEAKEAEDEAKEAEDEAKEAEDEAKEAEDEAKEAEEEATEAEEEEKDTEEKNTEEEEEKETEEKEESYTEGKKERKAKEKGENTKEEKKDKVKKKEKTKKVSENSDQLLECEV